MAGLGPAIHDFLFSIRKTVDARHKLAPGPAKPDPGGRA